MDKTKSRGKGYFTRTGYVDAFKVDNVKLDQDGLRFDIIERLD